MKIDDMSMDDLLALQKSITDNPENKNRRSGSIFLYTPQAYKKLDKIGRTITRRLAEKRAANGDPVPCDGYSGRQTNRR